MEALQEITEPVFITGDRVIMSREYYECLRAQLESHPADKGIPQAIKEIEERRASGKARYCSADEMFERLRKKYGFKL